MLRRAVAWLLLMLAMPAAAQTLPPFTGFVVDAANVLSPQVKADLSAKLQALRRDTKRQLIVATIPDLQGYPIEEYGNKLIRGWGVGLKDVNNGAILFIAPNEPKGRRGPRIEVGYGLEPILTDAFSSQVINEKMMPQLQAGDVPGAMIAGTDALVAQLRSAPEEAQARVDAAAADYDRTHRQSTSTNDGAGDGGGVPIGVIFFAVVVLFFVLPALSRGRRGRRWDGGGGSAWPIVLWSIGNELGRGGGGGGGGSGGGWSGGGSGGGSDTSWTGDFGGGGGGSGGGGGASGSW